MRFARSLTILLALTGPTQARADDEKLPRVEVGGTLFASYGYDLTDVCAEVDGPCEDMHMNAFKLDRAYLIARARLGQGFASRLTLDAGDTGAGHFVFVKHAYMEYSPKKEQVRGRFGMIDTPYTGYYDEFWEHRFVAKSFADSVGVLHTADLGASAQGTHKNGLVNWHAALTNGEGYKAPEVDSGKTLQGRLSIDPMAPKKGKARLPITAFVSQANTYDQEPVLTYIAAAGYRIPKVTLWAEYLGREDNENEVSAGGYSVSILPGMPKYGHLILRYDHFDPNTDADDDAATKVIVGASHDFVDRVSLAATFEQTTLEAVDTPTRGLFLRGQAGF